MADIKKPIFVGGGNGSPVATQDEVEHGKELAQRYRCEFVDLKNFHIQHELFRKIPVDLMFRYNFVPLEDKPEGPLLIATADPSKLMMIDDGNHQAPIGLALQRHEVVAEHQVHWNLAEQFVLDVEILQVHELATIALRQFFAVRS